MNNRLVDDWVSYLFLFVIVLYAGQSGGLSGLVSFDGSIIVAIIPVVMTFFLLRRHSISFRNKSFVLCSIVLFLWFIIQVLHHGKINASLTLFHFYQLSLSYIIVQVYQKKLFYVYEDIVYRLAFLSLVLWGISLFMPQELSSVLKAIGPSISSNAGTIYVYTMIRLDLVHGIIRNCGFAWEPGRYACFLCIAIFCNLLINGYRFKKNFRLWILVLALLTTQSTTGFFTLMVIMVLFVLNKNSGWRVVWLALLIPVALLLYRLDFVGEKSMNKLETETDIERLYDREGYSLDRIESAIIEWDNFKHDPITGYGEWRYSEFTQRMGLGFYTNNGTMTLLAKYGLLGFLYYLCIFISSKRIARFFNDRVSIGYFILFICIGMGYDFNQIVLVMAFSFWGIFMPKEVPIIIHAER